MSDLSFAAMVSICVISISIASVKGCQAVYNPETLKADADARIKIHEAFKNEQNN